MASTSVPRGAGASGPATWQSRAVQRLIEAGSSTVCAACDEPVKFKAKVKAHQVICNVYVDGRWDRVEHYHLACYTDAGTPYGEPSVTTGPTRVTPATLARAAQQAEAGQALSA